MSLNRHLTLASMLVLAACGTRAPATSAPEDAGEAVDAGDQDAGAVDSGVVDSGPVDAGQPDSGPADAGEPDAGEPDAGPADAGPTHTIKTVFIVLLENKNWSTVNKPADAPYITGSLLPHGAHADAYSNPPSVHPSLPNYLWLEAGTNFGVIADGDPSQYHQSSTDHLTTQLEAAGISWKSYQEGIDGNSCPLTGGNGYAPKHNPMIYFDDMTNTRDVNSQHCKDHVRPYSELATDLQNGTVARYNFITPNLCNDGHDDCIDTNPFSLNHLSNQVRQTDTWLSNALPPIFASDAYQDGGVVFVVWDESETFPGCLRATQDCPSGMLVFSPWAKSGYSNSITYDHSSTLRTVQEIFDLQPFLGGAANATDLSDMFEVFP